MQIVEIAAGTSDMTAARRLLESAGLPTDDLADPGVLLWGAVAAGDVVGVVGLEQAGRNGLLRSLVVAQSWRGKGLADELCRFAFARASEAHMMALYLLTESAADYFRALGFSQFARSSAPPEIAATRQFSSLCPGDSAFLRKPL